MIRVMSLTLALLVPTVALADPELAAAAAPAAPAPSATDRPIQAPLVPAAENAAAPAVAEARHCGAHGCGGAHHGGWLILTGVTATVVTAVAVGVAVGVANSHQPAPVTR